MGCRASTLEGFNASVHLKLRVGINSGSLIGTRTIELMGLWVVTLKYVLNVLKTRVLSSRVLALRAVSLPS